jgi:hypothetical protein
MKTKDYENLHAGERILRLLAGLGLCSSVLVMSGPLGWFVLLPLLGIYPALTAFTGYDPVRALRGYASASAAVPFRAERVSRLNPGYAGS